MNLVLQKSCVIAAITCGLCIAPSTLALATETTPPSRYLSKNCVVKNKIQ
ncbi:hypothetical protein HMPREF0091_10607 [Fannyhessea vaginae DSM 15829]|uniref:Uncharacterized protein n=1 Tax=Fannyhessea vaginae DSM 15829 TaxID=525256 RepID=F1T4L6_9ACTN|nr:hypothetical protein HMPREF0091_10607 [Fannyhessea vaginae DSM 15829]